MSSLQNSYGPEATPYEAINQTPPEYDATGRAIEKTPGTSAPEVSPSWQAESNEKNAMGNTSQDKRRICGLKPVIFWVLLAGLVAVVLGVGVGVGVGVGLKQNKSDEKSTSSQTESSSSPTSSPPPPPPPPDTTSSAPPTYITSGTHGLASNSCNTTTPRTAYVDNTAFTQYCYVDWPSSSSSSEKDQVRDLQRSVVYSFEDCMSACVRFNTKKPKVKCAAVTYISNLTAIIEVRGSKGNCFLKDKKGVDKQGSAESASAAMVSE